MTLIADPDVIVLDTRNDYEFRVGTFRNAVDPGIDSFSQFPAWVESHLHNAKGKKIATFCTGGIRCEKATSYMRFAGFEKVYHLKGGILKYLEEVPPEHSLWDGACYVFDERVAVGHGLQQADFTTCHGCLDPVSAADRLSPQYEEGVCCPQLCRYTDRRAKSIEPGTAAAIRAGAEAWCQTSGACRSMSTFLYLTLGSNDLGRSKRFYDPVMQTLGMTCSVAGETEIGYGPVHPKAGRARALLLSHQALPELPGHLGQRHAGGLQGREPQAGGCLSCGGPGQRRAG
jgi:rhodanese-related sulfurtransferase